MTLKTALAALLFAAPCFAVDSTSTIKIDLNQPKAAAPASAAKSEVFQNEEQKVLYSLGAAVARQIASFKLTPAELKFVTMGFKDQAGDGKLKLDLGTYGPQINNWVQVRQTAQQAAQAVKLAPAMEKEKKKAQAYIDKAAKEPGAQVSGSGLIYIEEKAGTGESPKATESVKAHYRGTLIDGTEFDSSYKRGEPTDFELNHVIPCWTEGIQKMKVGAKAKLICPTDIAYGAHPPTPAIAPGATLVFEVELIGINK